MNFEQYYSTTPYRQILWNRLGDREILDVFHRLRVPRNLSILSLGCGTGQKDLACVKAGYRIFGTDISPTAIATAKLLARKSGLPPQFGIMDSTRIRLGVLPRAWRQPNMVVDWQSLHNMPKILHRGYRRTIECLRPRWILVRTFSATDQECRRTGRRTLGSTISGIRRHFFSLEDLQKIYRAYVPVSVWEDPGYYHKRFLDGRATTKLTVLFLRRDQIFG